MSMTHLYLMIIIVNVKLIHLTVLPFQTQNKNGLTNYDNFLNSTPRIQEYRVQVNVANRFAETIISNTIENADDFSNFITFSAVIPEGAYINNFQMEMDDKVYKAVVLERDASRKILQQPGTNNKTILPLNVRARNSKRFTINVNAPPKTKAYFYLSYVELLERKNGQYEIIVNIQPGQYVDNLGVRVNINESQPIKFVNTPNLRSGNEAVIENNKLHPKATVNKNITSAIVTFEPDVEQQAEYACAGLGSREYDGFAGQFLVQYEIERNFDGCEKLEQNGFFLIFCAPQKLDPLPKHVVFALDTSYSMKFDKNLRIEQLKHAMLKILPQLNPEDLFNILEYNTAVHVWDLNLRMHNLSTAFQRAFNDLPDAEHASRENIEQAKKIIRKLRPRGSTNIMAGLEVALYLIKRVKQKRLSGYQPILMFLTDADRSGFNNSKDIIAKISHINKQEYNTPIYSISFGKDADWEFLRTLSLMNQGKATKIDIAEDTSIQLQDFYRKISAPLLRNITFYDIPTGEITQNHFPLYFYGSELAVAGKEHSSYNRSDIRISAKSKQGSIEIATKKESTLTHIDQAWAYLTMKQIMDQIYAGGDKSSLGQRASNIALKYSLLTDLTSFLLVNDDSNNVLETEDALKGIVPKVNTLSMCKNITEWIQATYPPPEPMGELEAPIGRLYSKLRFADITEEKYTTCNKSKYGCCYDNHTFAIGPNYSGCDPIPETDICFLPFNPSKCSNVTIKTTKWFYNKTRGICERFLYEGCENNGNRFNNRLSCESSCINASGKDRCRIPMFVGECINNDFQWYFDHLNDECIQIKEGCLQHTNRFSKRTDCLQLCKPDIFNNTQKARCYQPKNEGRGDCINYELNFYHDATTGLCQEFLYDGCGGNDNRFKTIQECEDVCLKE